jgi:hypothetical protein
MGYAVRQEERRCKTYRRIKAAQGRGGLRLISKRAAVMSIPTPDALDRGIDAAGLIEGDACRHRAG